jgi:hypothetical protein
VFRMSRSQILGIGEAVQKDGFEDQMVPHLRAFAPNDSAILGEVGVRRVVRLGVQRAAAHGITNVGLLRFHVELMFLFGSHFDTDPLLPWAMDVLADPATPDPERRSSRLYAALCAYIPAVAGPQRTFAIQSLRNLRSYGFDPPEGAAPRAQRILVALDRAYPERCCHLGDAALRRFVDRAAAEAASHALDTDRGVALVALAMFVLGHGFAVDPIYPWAQGALAEVVSQRERKLRQGLEAYVERSLHYLDGRRGDGRR